MLTIPIILVELLYCLLYYLSHRRLKHRHKLVIMKYVIILFALVALNTTVNAQTKTKHHAKHHMHSSAKDCVMMKDGTMMMMKNGKMMTMENDMTMKDGTVCMKDGTCKMKNGKTMMMKNGDKCYMNGKMMKMDKMDKMKM